MAECFGLSKPQLPLGLSFVAVIKYITHLPCLGVSLFPIAPEPDYRLVFVPDSRTMPIVMSRRTPGFCLSRVPVPKVRDRLATDPAGGLSGRPASDLKVHCITSSYRQQTQRGGCNETRRSTRHAKLLLFYLIVILSHCTTFNNLVGNITGCFSLVKVYFQLFTKDVESETVISGNCCYNRTQGSDTPEHGAKDFQ